jgi:hypothetical protein
MSTTFSPADEILQEEGAEATLTALASEVTEAESNLRTVLKEDEGRTWTIRDLQDAAANGHSSSVVSIAFLRLLKAGELTVDHATQAVRTA